MSPTATEEMPAGTNLLQHLSGENPVDGAGETAATAPASGKPDSRPAPDGGQTGSGAEGGNGAGTPASEPKGAAGKPDLAKIAAEKLNLTGPGEDSTEFYRKAWSESSAEAKRLAESIKGVNDALTTSGLRPERRADGTYGLMANDDYVEDSAKRITSEVLKSLTQEQKQSFLDDPDAVIGDIVKQTVGLAVSKPVPNMRSDEIQISELDARVVRDRLVMEKGADGNAALEGYEELEQWIQAIANDPQTPDSFRQFMNSSVQNHEFALRLLHGRVAYNILPYMQDSPADAQRRKRAQGDPSLTSEQAAAGSDTHGGNSDPQTEAQDEIINAPRVRF